MNLLTKLYLLHPFKTIACTFFKSEGRSTNTKYNILSLLVLKGGNIIISIILIPLTINYVNASEYGIWLALSSIINWFYFFDIGLANGLRNKFTECKAKGDDELIKKYISTTYAILFCVVMFLWVIVVTLNQYLDWSTILNTSKLKDLELRRLINLIMTYFCFQFILRIINTILMADQQAAKASLIDFLGQLLSLIAVWILTETTTGSLLKLGLSLTLPSLVTLLIANLYLFKKKYKKYVPSISSVDIKSVKSLLNLSYVFFVIQIAGLVQYESANLIIATHFTASDVTSYNIVYKYFGTINLIFSIFLNPFWSATTEAFILKDINWIKSGVRKYSYLSIFLSMVGVIMLLYSDDLFAIWLGKGKVNIPFSVSFWGLAFFCISMFAGKYLSVLNGISALKLQFYACFLSPLLYIFSTMLFIDHLKLGISSIFIAAIVSNFNGYLLAPIQYNQIIYKNKKGIWVK